MEHVIQLEGISKVFSAGFIPKQTTVLRNLSLHVARGEIYGYIGHNGAGKTTTLKIIMGLVRQTAGRVILFGQDTRDYRIREKIGFLPESPYFYTYLTGFEFLNFYGQLFGLDKKVRYHRIDSLLDMVGMSDKRGVCLKHYSKGMLQRTGVAQALINDPELVVFDEPMSGLDPVGRKDIRDIMVELKRRKKTVFFSTHILSDVEEICDSVGMLVQGELKKQGSISELAGSSGYSADITFSADASSALDAFAGHCKVIGTENSGPSPKITVSVSDEKIKDELIGRLVACKGRIYSVVPGRRALENIFMDKLKK